MTASPAWRTSRLSAGGVELARFTAGSDAPGAPVLLLLHGLGHWTGAAWDRLVPLLDPDLRIEAVDLPGFGASAKPAARYDPTFFRSVIGAFAERELPERFAVCGHSLGGMIAADLASAMSERLTHLALLAPAAFASTPRFVVRILASRLVGRFFTLRPSRRFVADTLAQAVLDPASLDPAVVDEAFALAQDPALRRAFAGVYAGAIQAMVDLAGLHRRFAIWTGPTFAGWGRHDRYIPVRALENVRRVYPQARTAVYERCGHLLMVEAPDAVAADLNAFLATSRPS